jgi:hypothetical protein
MPLGCSGLHLISDNHYSYQVDRPTQSLFFPRCMKESMHILKSNLRREAIAPLNAVPLKDALNVANAEDFHHLVHGKRNPKSALKRGD